MKISTLLRRLCRLHKVAPNWHGERWDVTEEVVYQLFTSKMPKPVDKPDRATSRDGVGRLEN